MTKRIHALDEKKVWKICYSRDILKARKTNKTSDYKYNLYDDIVYMNDKTRITGLSKRLETVAKDRKWWRAIVAYVKNGRRTYYTK